MKVRIKNYQILKDVDLTFNVGLTAIVGESNNGKSSIIRAVESAINNRGGDSFVNYDADECSVDIFSDDNHVKWVKSKKPGKSYYEVNGERLHKIGQKQVDDVADVLKMPQIPVNNERFKINFWKQMDYPFLVGKTPYQLFDFISNSKEHELLSAIKDEADLVLKELKSDEDSMSTKIDVRQQDIAREDEIIKNLEKTKDFDFELVEKLMFIERELSSKITSYEDKVERSKEVRSYFDKVSIAIADLETLLDSVAGDAKLVKELSDALGSYDERTKIYDNLKDKHKDTQSLIDKCDEELSKFDVCPLCGSRLNKDG